MDEPACGLVHPLVHGGFHQLAELSRHPSFLVQLYRAYLYDLKGNARFLLARITLVAHMASHTYTASTMEEFENLFREKSGFVKAMCLYVLGSYFQAQAGSPHFGFRKFPSGALVRVVHFHPEILLNAL